MLGEDDGIRERAVGRCLVGPCESTFVDDYWGKVEATNKGWFFRREGGQWCPDHLPGWVKGYRNPRQAKKKG